MRFLQHKPILSLIAEHTVAKGFTLALLITLLTSFSSCGQSSFSDIDFGEYPWLHPELNTIQYYDKDALAAFHTAWKNASKEKLVVVDLGDSHLQSDILPGELRKDLQSIHGDGGRGMMFPYGAANTYSSIEYKTTYTGEWTYAKSLAVPPKLPLGLSGMTVRTSSPDAALHFAFQVDVPEHYTQLRLFCKKQANSFDLSIETGGSAVNVSVHDAVYDEAGYFMVNIPPVTNRELTIRTVKTQDDQNTLEFYGLCLESEHPAGAIVHNCGVGGARYQSILYEQCFSSQLATVEPDVVIVDFGTNDYLYDDIIKPELEDEVTRVVSTIRSVAPNASIILTTAHDLYYKGRHISSGDVFAELIHRVAKKEHCGVWDWFWIAGGRKSMYTWHENGLSQNDMVHLNMKGYKLKGDMLAMAMMKTADWIDRHPNDKELIWDISALKDSVSTAPDVTYIYVPASQRRHGKKHGGHGKSHTVKSGETINGIARKYGVSADKIRRVNGIKGNTIHKGKAIVIPK